MFDFHLHLARLPHKKQLTQLLCDRKYDFVAVACEPWEWNEVAQLKKEFSSEIKPFMVSFGIHPMMATQTNDEMFEKLREFLKDNEHAMVGEAGIDKRYPGYEDGTQDQVFLEQAKLAVELGRDLQIHCVGNYMRVLRLLAEAGFEQGQPNALELQKAPRPIFHRFGGDLNVVKKAIPYGVLFSLHADSFRKKSTIAAIPHIPQERVFFETDADETFMRGNSATAKGPVTSTAIVDPGTGSGVTDKGVADVTSESAAGVTSESAENTDNVTANDNNATANADNVILNNAKDSETSSSAFPPRPDRESNDVTPEAILAELEKRIESVRAAYAECRE